MAGFIPIKNQRIYQQVVEQIQAMVLNGTLKSGDKLPTERALAEKFQVSRASIREALRALEIIGIIECRQGDGNFISDTLGNSVFEPLSVMFKLHNGSFRDILEFRMMIEIEAASLAAQRIKQKDKLKLMELVQHLEQSDNDESSAQIDTEIHYKIAAITGNYLITSMLSAISTLMKSFIEEARLLIFKWGENRKHLLAVHKNLCEAICNNQPETAASISRKHFEFIIDNLEK